MNGLFVAALEIQGFLEKKKWRFCIIGGLAVVRWGEVRATQDVDVTLLTEFGNEESFVDQLLAEFDGRIDNTREFALRHRTLLLRSSDGVDIDVALAGIPFEESAVRRATYFDFTAKVSLLTCSAEDLLVFKVFANRTRDWMDVEGIIYRQVKGLDWDYIDSKLEVLLDVKGAPELLERLHKTRMLVT